MGAQNFKRDRLDSQGIRYTGHLRAAGRKVSVAITFPDLEFTRLPTLELLDPEKEAPDVVAHLGISGAFCFAQEGDIVLDRYNVGGTALSCLELARQGLERAIARVDIEGDVAREFPQHWLGAPIYCDMSIGYSGPARLYTVSRSERTKVFLLSDTRKSVSRVVIDSAEYESVAASGKAAFVFRSKSTLSFGKTHRQPITLADFFNWVDSVAPNKRDRAIKELCAHFPKTMPALFVCSDNGCVGVSVKRKGTLFRAIKRREALARIMQRTPDKILVDRWSGTPIDPTYVFERNMDTQKPLSGRRIALIGCGTIGSHLAKLLVQSGAGHAEGVLLLLDNQLLEPANVGRHYLGMNSIGDYKSDALKDELGRSFPDTNLRASRSEATLFFEKLNQFDLIVDATGEEALSVSINHFLLNKRREGTDIPALYVRLFGNGAAAQTFLVDDLDHACFKCLRPDHGADWRHGPMKSSAETVTSVAACGEGQYIAYDVSAPMIAAALALKAALAWSNGSSAPRLRTLRIDKKTTQRIADKNVSRSNRCRACNPKK